MCSLALTRWGSIPPASMVTVGNRQTIAFAVPTGSGAHYTNDAVDFWDHHGEATITWSGVKYVCKAS